MVNIFIKKIFNVFFSNAKKQFVSPQPQFQYIKIFQFCYVRCDFFYIFIFHHIFSFQIELKNKF